MLAFVASKDDLGKDVFFAERKFDGTRVFVIKNRNRARLVVARGVGTDFSRKYPLIIGAIKKLNCVSCVLDAEFVFFDKRGSDVFLTMAAGPERVKSLKYKVMVFDILFLDGKDVRGLPIEERKSLIKRVIPKGLPIIPVAMIKRNVSSFFGDVVKKGGEGIVLKKKHSVYVPGRSHDWLKVKKGRELDVIVKGFTVSKEGSRLPYFRALKCYYPIDGSLKYVGDVGSGFNFEDLKQITPVVKSGKPFVIQVRFMEFSPNMHMRHPVFVRLRPDKSLAEVMRG